MNLQERNEQNQTHRRCPLVRQERFPVMKRLNGRTASALYSLISKQLRRDSYVVPSANISTTHRMMSYRHDPDLPSYSSS